MATERVENHQKFLAQLQREVEVAAKNARPVTLNSSGTIKEFDEDYQLFHQKLKNNEIVKFKKNNLPHVVTVDDPNDYQTLLLLAHSQVIKTKFNLSDIQLEEYKVEHSENLNHCINEQLEHELEHFKGAMEHTTLQCFLGVMFFTLNGQLDFLPITNFDGEARSDTFLQYVVLGPERPSGYDQIVASSKTTPFDLSQLQNIKI